MLDFFIDNTRLSFTIAAVSLFLSLIFFMVFARSIFKSEIRSRSSFLGFAGGALSNFVFALSLLSGVIGMVAGAIQSV